MLRATNVPNPVFKMGVMPSLDLWCLTHWRHIVIKKKDAYWLRSRCISLISDRLSNEVDIFGPRGNHCGRRNVSLTLQSTIYTCGLSWQHWGKVYLTLQLVWFINNLEPQTHISQQPLQRGDLKNGSHTMRRQLDMQRMTETETARRQTGRRTDGRT